MLSTVPANPDSAPPPSARGATRVALGILLSRLSGLIRTRVFAHAFGTSPVAGAFSAALRIPNTLQNLLGEGVLSASFIPVYARLLGEKEEDAAERVAGAVFGLLSLATAVLVVLGVAGAPWLARLVAGGYAASDPEAFAKTVELTRILFPSTGLLVMSAWCLGVLNSHRRFFLSYTAPVAWNAAQIALLVAAGGRVGEGRLATLLAWSVVGGSLLQFLIQLPSVLRLLGTFRPSLETASAGMRTVLRNFLPVVLSRGVVQVSALVDTFYASLISAPAVSALYYAQLIGVLPVSLFGMSVSAAELPELSRESANKEGAEERLRRRLDAGLRRIAYFVIPSAVAFFALGDVVGGLLVQTGRFGGAETRQLWYLLMGSSVGLLAGTLARLYASAFYALHDARTPLRFATARVLVAAALAYLAVRRVPAWLDAPAILGCAGITAASGVAAWLEFLLLRRALNRRVGKTGVGAGRLFRLWASATVAAVAALVVKVTLVVHYGPSLAAAASWGGWALPAPALHPVLTAALLLPLYGAIYFGLTTLLGASELTGFMSRYLRRRAPGP
jgi:putative peptidoglycan lipid II flippase